jgi:hypothetical protein
VAGFGTSGVEPSCFATYFISALNVSVCECVR